MTAEPGATRHRSAYGWRARLGLITPPTNTVNEPEWARLTPPGVSFHTCRMPVHVDTESPEARREMERDLSAAIAALVPAGLDVIALACTVGSMSLPLESGPNDITSRAGVKGVTTASAIIYALRALGASRIALATPYHDAFNAHEVEFLQGSGIEVLAVRGLGIGACGPQDYPLIAQTPLAEIEALALSVVRPEAQALLISCTDFPTLPLIGKLEAYLGIPVVTSNTATLWRSLRAAGITDAIEGAGRLLREA